MRTLLVGSKLIVLAAAATSILAALPGSRPFSEVPLASLDLAKMKVQAAGGRGGANAQNVAQANKSIDGNPIRIGGKEFSAGVGTRATSVLFVNLDGAADRFHLRLRKEKGPRHRRSAFQH